MSPRAVEYGVLDVVDVVENVLHVVGEATGDEYKIVCPNPRHLDTRPSCSINTDTGYWSCFSCGIGGDLAELARTVMSITQFEAQSLLKPSTNEGILQVLKRRLDHIAEANRTVRITPVRRARLPGPYDSGPMEYMHDRGLSQETCERWGVRYVRKETLQGKKGKFTIRSSIAIPIRGSSGHLQAWCYRSTPESPRWQPKYLYSPGVEISDLWYGHQHHADAKHILVVEGGLDTMWSDQCGFATWGLLGSKMGVSKILRLTERERVVLMADNDDAGYEWVKRVTDQIGRRVPTYICQYRSWMLSKRPDQDGVYQPATDPEELRATDLEIMYHTAVPYIKWKYM